MAIKRKPHHDLAAVKAKFAQVETLEITRTAVEGARALGYSLEDIVEAVQELEAGDFYQVRDGTQPAQFEGLARHLQHALGRSVAI
jgi:motility quorum-sensing regulator/GCU-specific mRNA interferase toxin